jgi:SAM-dependent methyltransferase
MAETADSKERFSGRSEDYAKYRPHYPQEITRFLEREFGLRKSWIIADMGCGTGLSSEPFLKAGCRVIGIEPNAEMRAAANKAYREETRFRAVDGSAEESGLPGKSVDLYVAGQAFHWFKVSEASREAKRILKPPRRALLMWNDRLASASPFMYEFCVFLEKRRDLVHPRRRSDPDGEDFNEFFGIDRWKRKKIRHWQDLAWEELEGGLFSASYSPMRGEEEARSMVDEAVRIFSHHESAGIVRMEYETTINYGTID